jgi:hypothetical protein
MVGGEGKRTREEVHNTTYEAPSSAFLKATPTSASWITDENAVEALDEELSEGRIVGSSRRW